MTSTKHQDAVVPDSRKNADEAALELMKQLITLAAGVLALSATFIQNLGAHMGLSLVLLALAWVCLICSVFFGLETISAIVKSRLSPEHDWSEGYGKTSAQISKYCFVGGLALFAVFAFLTLLMSSQTGNKRVDPSQGGKVVEQQAVEGRGTPLK